ncbi:phosphatidylserine decarboxylase family protein [Trichlorobacter ammonificans]|nr:phosphatidylserine decarboxylase family protein [Trichlorobacter ammonificans]
MRPSPLLITPEGYPYIAYSAGLFLLLASGAWLFSSAILAVPAIIVLGLCLFTISFFRNPRRTAPADPTLVVAPADGTVVYVGPAQQELLGECCKISIFMSVFNVHINWVPFSGNVIDRFYRQGRFLDARDPRSSSENEQLGLVLETDGGERLVAVQIAGLVARRIICYAEPGDRLERGTRYGLIRFGSRVDLYLPSRVSPLVKTGETTVAGETPLASLA